MKTTGIGALLVASVLLAGCGGGSSSGPSDARKDWPTFARESPDQIRSAVHQSMAALSAAHVSAAGAMAGGKGYSLDIRADSAGDCIGSIGSGATGTLQLLGKDGTTWFKGDKTFWQNSVGDRADEVIAATGDRWVVDTTGNLSRYCNINLFVHELLDNILGSTYDVEDVLTRDGQQVVKVSLGTKDAPADGFIQTSGKHYFTSVVDSEGAPYGAVDFHDLDKPVKVKAPSPDQVFTPGTTGVPS